MRDVTLWTMLTSIWDIALAIFIILSSTFFTLIFGYSLRHGNILHQRVFLCILKSHTRYLKRSIDSRLKICLRYIRRRVINFLFANVLCIRFLIDEAFKLGTSRSKKELFYLIHEKSFKNDEKGFLFHLTHYLSHCWLTNNSSTCIDQYVKK